MVRVQSDHKLFVYGDEKSSMFIPFILFIDNPYLGTFSQDSFLHSGFLRKDYIKCYLPVSSKGRRTCQGSAGLERAMSKVLLHAPEKHPASFVSCASLFNGTESAVGHPRGRGKNAPIGRQIQQNLFPFAFWVPTRKTEEANAFY